MNTANNVDPSFVLPFLKWKNCLGQCYLDRVESRVRVIDGFRVRVSIILIGLSLGLLVGLGL